MAQLKAGLENWANILAGVVKHKQPFKSDDQQQNTIKFNTLKPFPNDEDQEISESTFC